jgi:outer membrane phospholipase A
LPGLVIFLATVVLSASATEPKPASVFLAPAEPLISGSQADVWRYEVNNGSLPLSQTFETAIGGQLVCGSNVFNTPLTLDAKGEPLTEVLQPGSFLKRRYQFQLPPNQIGVATLEISNYNPVTLVILSGGSVAATSVPTALPASATVPASAPPIMRTNGSAQMADYLRRQVVDHISYYQPIYFLLGNPIAEFQLSLKYQIFGFQNAANPFANVADHLFFAYTQTSYWDLLTADPYFYDNSYKPSVFIYYPNLIQRRSWQFDFQGGTEHESNGRGGSNERSQYTAYLQPTFTVDLPEHLSLSFQPRARFYYWVGNNNRDIAEYRGYADLLGALTWQRSPGGERIQLSTKFQIGDEGAHPGWLFDLRFNLAGLSWLQSFNPTIQLQYFTGYGQTLIQYNQKSSAFRAGLCLWY